MYAMSASPRSSYCLTLTYGAFWFCDLPTVLATASPVGSAALRASAPLLLAVLSSDTVETGLIKPEGP